MLYTGSDCRSDTGSLSDFWKCASRKTIIDDFLEELAAILFVILLIIAFILGMIRYHYLRKRNDLTIVVQSEPRARFVVVVVENYFVMSLMISVTLKLVLLLLRYVYGLYIGHDANFIDEDIQVKPISSTSNITESIGNIDVIITDETEP
jgi:magnesium-transporting ATPase (P-type)